MVYRTIFTTQGKYMTTFPQTSNAAEKTNIERYHKELLQFDRLNREEEVALAIRIEGGDGHALKALVTSNLRLVLSVAKSYASRVGVPVEDLISDGLTA